MTAQRDSQDGNDRLFGFGLVLAGIGAILAVAPFVVSVEQRASLYVGTVLLFAGILLVVRSAHGP